MLTTYQKLNEYTTQTGLGRTGRGIGSFKQYFPFHKKNPDTQRYAMLLYGKILRAF